MYLKVQEWSPKTINGTSSIGLFSFVNPEIKSPLSWVITGYEPSLRMFFDSIWVDLSAYFLLRIVNCKQMKTNQTSWKQFSQNNVQSKKAVYHGNIDY